MPVGMGYLLTGLARAYLALNQRKASQSQAFTPCFHHWLLASTFTLMAIKKNRITVFLIPFINFLMIFLSSFIDEKLVIVNSLYIYKF